MASAALLLEVFTAPPKLIAAGVRVPKPYGHFNDTLIMELVTDAAGALPRAFSRCGGCMAHTYRSGWRPETIASAESCAEASVVSDDNPGAVGL